LMAPGYCNEHVSTLFESACFRLFFDNTSFFQLLFCLLKTVSVGVGYMLLKRIRFGMSCGTEASLFAA
jgi:hypothetical protein